jgi:hypothetical protein
MRNELDVASVRRRFALAVVLATALLAAVLTALERAR